MRNFRQYLNERDYEGYLDEDNGDLTDEKKLVIANFLKKKYVECLREFRERSKFINPKAVYRIQKGKIDYDFGYFQQNDIKGVSYRSHLLEILAGTFASLKNASTTRELFRVMERSKRFYNGVYNDDACQSFIDNLIYTIDRMV